MFQKIFEWFYAQKAKHYLRKFSDLKALYSSFLLSREEALPEARFLDRKMDECMEKVHDVNLKHRLMVTQRELVKSFNL